MRCSLFLLFFLGLIIEIRAQKPEVLFHHLDFKASEDKTLTEFRIFTRNSAWNAMSNPMAKVSVLLVNAKGDSVDYESVILRLPFGAGITQETVLPYTFAKALKPGRYKAFLTVKDGETRDSIASEIPLTVKSFSIDSITVAQPMLVYSVNPAKKPSITTKSGLDLEIHPLNFFPQAQDFLQIYGEIYHPKLTNLPYLIRGGIANEQGVFFVDFTFNKRPDSAEATAILRNLNIKDLPSGSYQIRFEALDENNKVIASAYTEFNRSNPPADHVSVADNDSKTKLSLAGSFAESMSIEDLKKYIAALQPIATETEKHVIPIMLTNTDVLGMRQFLLSFWRKRKPNDPSEAFNDYKKRLHYAQSNYSATGMNIYQTDRGRVLLQFGFPNQVENEITDRQRSAISSNNTIGYEIWYYYKTSKTNQNNIQFVFIQENRGNNNYRLVHSNALGEINYPSWRTALQNNNTQGNNNFTTQPSPR